MLLKRGRQGKARKSRWAQRWSWPGGRSEVPGRVWPWEPGAGDPGSEGQSWGHLLRQCPGQAGDGARLKSSCPGHQFWQRNVVLTWDGTSPWSIHCSAQLSSQRACTRPREEHASWGCSSAVLRSLVSGGVALPEGPCCWLVGVCTEAIATAPVLPLTHQAARQGLTFPCCSRFALPSQWKREVGGRHGRARTEYGPPNLSVSLSSMC